MTSLLKFLPPELVVFADSPLLEGLSKHQKLLCMLAIFVLDFAEVEHSILRRVIKLSRVSEEVAKAIFSGVRADGAMDYAKRLLEISDESEDNKERYLKAFTQFKLITEVRNLILHYGLERSRESIVTTNKRIALSESRLRSIPISVEILEDLIKDIARIDTMLSVTAMARGQQESDLPPEWEPLLISFRAPWHYKPLQAQTKKSRPQSEKATRKLKQAPKEQR